MTDIATISALPIGAFFREGWLPLTYRDGKPILTINGVEHDAAELLRRFMSAGPLTDVVAMSASVESKRVLQLHYNREVTDEDRQRLVAFHNAALQEPRYDR